MTKTFNCKHTERQPRKRCVCEWCAVDWRSRLDEIARIMKVANGRCKRAGDSDTFVMMHVKPDELREIYELALKQ